MVHRARRQRLPPAPAAAPLPGDKFTEAHCLRHLKLWVPHLQTSLPHYREAWCIARAVSRYRQFLHLHRLNPGRFIVPPYDVDLVWHTHMVRMTHHT